MTASAQTAAAKEIANGQPMLHATLAPALVAALANLTVVATARTADMGTFSYKYAELGDVVKATRETLAQHGLVALTPVHEHGDGLACTVTILHASGERMDFGPLPFPHGRDAQATGSMITYHRRYALVAALGMAAGDDDDGAAAKPRQPRTISPKSMAKATLMELVEGDKAKAKAAWEGIGGDDIRWDGETVASVKDRYEAWVNEDPSDG